MRGAKEVEVTGRTRADLVGAEKEQVERGAAGLQVGGASAVDRRPTRQAEAKAVGDAAREEMGSRAQRYNEDDAMSTS